MNCPICKEKMTYDFLHDGIEIWYCTDDDCQLGLKHDNFPALDLIEQLTVQNGLHLANLATAHEANDALKTEIERLKAYSKELYELAESDVFCVTCGDALHKEDKALCYMCSLHYHDLIEQNRSLVEQMNEMALKHSGLVVWIAEYCYKKANPDSKMCCPSIVYEQVEADLQKWFDSK